jgi:phosphoserine phosphatase RsbU/P
MSALNGQPITVLLVDDQAVIGEAVRLMLEDESDIRFRHCKDPAKAVETANEIRPTVILQDLVMPDIDGLTLVERFRANPPTRDVPMIVLSTKEEPTVKAQAFAVGANDYVVKLPDRLELVARVRYHSNGYVAQLQRDEAYRKIEESRSQMAEELAQAARFVKSLLPAPLVKGGVSADWRFEPSTQLGGDTFSYRWLDDDHLVVFLLDVCGHGVGAALLAVSVMHVLRSQELLKIDFRDPGGVLRALNEAFQMEKEDDKYFTIWYGVYHRPTRTLRYCGGGHPPALLFTGPSRAEERLVTLESKGPGVGMWETAPFRTAEVAVGASGRLYLFSDGVYEVTRAADKTVWPFEEFVAYLSALPPDEAAPMDRLLEHVRTLHGAETLEDDFSLVELRFGPG